MTEEALNLREQEYATGLGNMRELLDTKADAAELTGSARLQGLLSLGADSETH